MPIDYTAIVLIILVLSIVQSVFGMGVLVFGTPTLLLLGVDYKDTLVLLLPSSLSISVLQVVQGWHFNEKTRVHLGALACIPFIAIGLLISLRGWPTRSTTIVIGAFLIFGALIRISTSVRAATYRCVQRSRILYLITMGLIHGVSNMGGALLAVYAAAATREKDMSRFIVACFYLVFGLTQISVLLVTNATAFTPLRLSIVPFAILGYTLIGNKLYRYASEMSYQHALTFFTGVYGATLLLKTIV